MPIVVEAGGRFSSLAGVDLDAGGGSALATNGLLHEDVLDLIGDPPPS
jgi:histidinol-phosphatase